MDTKKPLDETPNTEQQKVEKQTALRLQVENEILKAEIRKYGEMLERIEKALFENGGGTLTALTKLLEKIHMESQELVAQNRALSSKLRLETVLIELVQVATAAMMAQAVAAQEA